MARLRFSHFEIVPVYVVDDGDDVTIRPGQPFQVAAAALDAFPAKWAKDFAALQADFASQNPPPANRAARRAKP